MGGNLRAESGRRTTCQRRPFEAAMHRRASLPGRACRYHALRRGICPRDEVRSSSATNPDGLALGHDRASAIAAPLERPDRDHADERWDHEPELPGPGRDGAVRGEDLPRASRSSGSTGATRRPASEAAARLGLGPGAGLPRGRPADQPVPAGPDALGRRPSRPGDDRAGRAAACDGSTTPRARSSAISSTSARSRRSGRMPTRRRARNARLPGEPGRSPGRLRARWPARVGPFRPALCHNDLLPANLIADDGRLWLVDWEYAGHGPPPVRPRQRLGQRRLHRGRGRGPARGLSGRGRGSRTLEELRVFKAASALREALWAVIQSVASELDLRLSRLRRPRTSRSTSGPGRR